MVETVFYDGPIETPNPNDTDHGHYWIGGAAGKDGKWAMRQGPSYPDIIWDFFSRHPRSGALAPTITLKGDNPIRVIRGQLFTDPGAIATDAQGTTITVNTDCSGVNINQIGQYICTYQASDSTGQAASASRTVLVVDASSCDKVRSSLFDHVSAGRAHAGGWFGWRAFANGDETELGFTWSVWPQVTLYEGEPGRWYAHKRDGC